MGCRGQWVEEQIEGGHLPSVYPVCSPGEMSSGMEFSLSLESRAIECVAGSMGFAFFFSHLISFHGDGKPRKKYPVI